MAEDDLRPKDARGLFAQASTAVEYVRHRPTYPREAFDHIAQYAKENGAALGTCADIATGSGQAAFGLATLYESVIGIDASAAQVEAGMGSRERSRSSNVTFQVGTAEATGLDDGSVDAVCVAEALHWFDQPAFWKECMRILRPGGVVAIIGYSAAQIVSNEAANVEFNRLFYDELGPYWHSNRRLIDDLYRGCEPPSPPFNNVKRVDGLQIQREWSISDAIGNARSWSGYATKMEKDGIARGSAADPALIMAQKLEQILGSDDAKMNVAWPLCVILATKPH